ncbi:Uncharacterised protein [Vibrio cholerae]|uniref:Uncharacterized protein n=1 Tax=Vibrio cholerae TaxID=666 RepID=A0A656AAS9_VIBCL|nr:Uncharacterised protein [Vibrio cholerae]CRZ91339.1 Uncharacterised protein [Vibrio cholerae]CSA99662.1 Uncharacterised protein [Vibrio cholerae]CSB07431.1 Uncharacterised protein [Vibrio cholerae]CSB17133.1 Uncharacterised protein [Vibrio cholerae]
MTIWETYESNFIPFLQNGITIRMGQNAMSADTLNITACLTVDTQLAQITTVDPVNQFRSDSIGTDDRQIDFTLTA